MSGELKWRKPKGIEDEQNVPVTELLSSKFIAAHSSYPDLVSLLEASGMDSREAFEEVNRPALDAHIAASTEFASLDDMLLEAAGENLARRMGL